MVLGRSTSRRTLLGVVGASVTAALGLSACTPGASGPMTPGPAMHTLVVGATAEPATMDPTAGPAAAVPQVMLYNVYETLVRIDAEGHLKPLLAQKYDLSDDRKTYTFTLNPAAKFASGAPVKASDVVANFERMRQSKVAMYAAQMSLVTSVTAPDDATVVVTLSRPSNQWLYDITSTVGMVIEPAGFETLGTKTAGSGPMQLQSWTPRDSITLEKNPGYWGTPVRFDTVTFQYFADPNAMSAAMQAGELDVISNLQAPDGLSQFEDPEKFTILNGATSGEVVLSLNHATPALKDVRVRKAITMAIDRKKLLDVVWNGKGTLIGTMVAPTDPYYEDLANVTPYDPERAKALLKEAGVTDLTLRFRPAALPYATKATPVVAEMLNKVGIKTKVEEQQFPSRWVDTVYVKGDYDMSLVAHVEARDINSFTNPNYYWHYNSPEFNKLFLEADTASEEEFVPKMKAAARYLATDAAAVWLFSLPNLVVTKSTITGVPADARTLSFDVTTIATR